MNITVIRMLAKIAENCVLTGSQFFGTANENSDWDFATSDEKFWLSLEGLDITKTYRLPNTQIKRMLIDTIQIDIQLRKKKDHAQFLKVQTFIKEHDLYTCDKKFRKRFWTALSDVL